MPIYLVVAYVIFCTMPLGLGIVLHLRLRHVMRDAEQIERSGDGRPI
jgi:hypothetical protein